MLKRILVPLDGSALSAEVLPTVKRLLEGMAGEVTLFMAAEAPRPTRRRRPGLRTALPIAAGVTGPLAPGMLQLAAPAYAETRDQAVERQEHEIMEYLDQAGRSLVETGRPIHAAVHFGEPAKEIIAFAKRGRFDLILMATHGRSGLRETLQGSVTAEVIRSGVAPVLVVRPKSRRTPRKR
jgi:nucleotide-binding universal stress UspA family protein